MQTSKSFEINQIDEALLKILKKEIQPIDFLNDTLSELQKNHDFKKVNRNKEIITNNNLKDIALNYSLTAIHNRREEERIEQERIEKEKILNEQYKLLLENANSLLNDKEFDRAKSELEKALDIKPNRINEIQKLIKTISKRQKDFEKRRIEFKQLFKNAENEFHNDKLEKSIELFTQAQQFDIDNYRCRKRISDAHNKIERIKYREAERKRIEQEEQERREKYKDDAQAIMQYFEQNEIKQFYHYTDSRNLHSILQSNGLYSLNELHRKGIDYEQGSDTSEKPDYVRLSYANSHPLMHVSIRKNRIINPKVLHIDKTVSKLRNTLFSNVNVARTSRPPTVITGNNLDFLKRNVKLDITKRNYFNLTDEEKAYYQAEVMIKEHVPLEYITNL